VSLTVLDHPAVADRLARIRDERTPGPVFRRLIEELGVFLAIEATRELALVEDRVTTPVAPAAVRRLAKRPVVAPIFRAGLGLLPGFLSVVDDAIVAHLGMYRDPETLAAIPYYANVPPDLSASDVFVLDPMLATGHSGIAALGMLAERGARRMTVISVISAQPGVDAMCVAYPDVRIVTAALDATLNAHGYIVPGLGDAGDRMFGSVSSVPAAVRPWDSPA
jgi:uracil phosphoribosyltransferase